MPFCPSSVDIVFSNRDLAITTLRLLSLPNEVLTMICTDDEISAKDMCAIRLTCKELRAIVEKDFAKRYFQDPFVMMTRESLQALVDICKHPVFGPHVRKVQLLNRLHDPHRLSVLADKMAHASCWRRLEEMAQARRQLEDFTALIDEQYGLLGSKQALKILSEAFKALGEMGNPITLASQKLALPFRPIGWTKMPDKFDCEQTPPLMAIPEVLSTTQILLDAAKAGDCTSTKLEVGVDSSVKRMHGFQQNTLFPSWPRLNKPLLADMDELCFAFVGVVRSTATSSATLRRVTLACSFDVCQKVSKPLWCAQTSMSPIVIYGTMENISLVNASQMCRSTRLRESALLASC
ncbi:unnamed protein product [Aureobasidium pullulans]|nr:unnamed protein product [Aureobasidium pullulans]